MAWVASQFPQSSVHSPVPPIIILYQKSTFQYKTANVLKTKQNIFLCRLSFGGSQAKMSGPAIIAIFAAVTFKLYQLTDLAM